MGNEQLIQELLKAANNPASGNLNEIIKAVTTGGDYGSNGLMPNKVALTFLKQIFDDTSYLGKVRNEPVKTISGSQPKMGVGSRLLRSHTEGNDDITGNEVVPTLGNIPYTNKYMTLGTAISEEWLEQNIELENFEKKFLGLIAEQERVDILDLAFNGDEATASSESDYAFLKMNDGFIKQIKNGGHVVDNATINGGVYNEKVFTQLKLAVPAKLRNSNFKWHVSDTTYEELLDILTARNTTLGDNILLNGDNIKIRGHFFEKVPHLPDDVIIYADPKNFMITWFLNIIHGKTKEGKEALFKRMRYYATFLACDFVVQDLDAAAILINRGDAVQNAFLVSNN